MLQRKSHLLATVIIKQLLRIVNGINIGLVLFWPAIEPVSLRLAPRSNHSSRQHPSIKCNGVCMVKKHHLILFYMSPKD